MTIISIVCVPEGMAMASDSRLLGAYTRENGMVDRFIFSDQAQKLLLIRNTTIGVSFCGDAFIDGKTTADFLRDFDKRQVLDSTTVPEIADKLHNDLLRNGSEQYNISFYLAGYDSDMPYVYLVNKDHIIRKNFSEINQVITYSASWHGEIAPISRLLQETPINFKLMPLKDAIDLAEFIVETTINYLRFSDVISTCGGPIDSLVISKDYTKYIKHKILQPY
jgi:hypothetical protein